jgi:cell wall-associated NlpC family hydrolase
MDVNFRNMTDLSSHSRPRSAFNFLSPLALTLIFLFGSSFSGTEVRVDRAADAEMMELRTFVAGYAQNFVGIPYRHAGSSTRSGFDCSGFTSFVLKEFDLKVSPCSSTQSKEGDTIELEEVLPGDLIFFGGRKKYIQHVAMVVEKTEEGIICVHSTSSRGVVVENISTSKYWKPKILFARDVITGQAK